MRNKHLFGVLEAGSKPLRHRTCRVGERSCRGGQGLTSWTATLASGIFSGPAANASCGALINAEGQRTHLNSTTRGRRPNGPGRAGLKGNFRFSRRGARQEERARPPRSLGTGNASSEPRFGQTSCRNTRAMHVLPREQMDVPLLQSADSGARMWLG